MRHPDPAHSEEGDTSLVFSRENQLLGDHLITRGRDDSERVNRIRTFTGTSSKAPREVRRSSSWLIPRSIFR